jgi:glycosyltransferase involved in cell wall biosynthesis
LRGDLSDTRSIATAGRTLRSGRMTPEGRAAAVTLSLIVPARDEVTTIGTVLDQLDALPLPKQVIVIDDGSRDGTGELVERRSAGRSDLMLLRTGGRGKGAAIRAAIPHLTGEITVIQDADLEYDPEDIPGLIEPILRGAADAVYGSRLTGGRPHRAYLFTHLLANRILTLLADALYNTTLTDIETGYKAFRTDVLRSLRLREDGFGFEAEVTARLCRNRLRVYELPVAYYGRTYADGKKIGWRDGVRALYVLVAIRFGAH